jgi:hypothetical protein
MRNELLATAAAALCLAGALPAAAEDAAPPVDYSLIKYTALLDAGGTWSNSSSNTGGNTGMTTTDKNGVKLNQLMLTAQKDMDPKAAGWDWGFKLQGYYGSDARYTHFLGVFDRMTQDRNQFDIVEANGQAHMPYVTSGGIDVKAGMYATPLGSEVIPANGNYLYSHSYIFNYGLPFKHTGVLTNTHVNDTLDVYLGVDTGTNTTFGNGSNNGHILHGIAGIGLNGLADGKLTVLALSHFGPENPEWRPDQPNGTGRAAHKNRFYGDITATYKASDVWTFVTELNYVREDLAPGVTTNASQSTTTAFGLAQYGVYAAAPWLSLIGRAEIFSDRQNFFVGSFPGNRDFVNFERGKLCDYNLGGSTTCSLSAASTPITYGELTLGANITHPNLPGFMSGAMLRPEVRWDTTLNGAKAFNYNAANTAQGTSQWSLSMDLVIPLTYSR